MFQLKLFSLLMVIAMSVVLSILPSKGLDQLFVNVADFFSVTDILRQYNNSEITNVGHSLAMFVITLSALSVLPGRIFSILLIAVSVSAGLEWLQSYVPSRTVSWYDFSYDLLGIGCALLVISLLYLVKRLKSYFFPAPATASC